jgi:hypothetical protein
MRGEEEWSDEEMEWDGRKRRNGMRWDERSWYREFE